MLFNSLEFLIFFPISLMFYFTIPHKFRWIVLFITSCIFYMAFIPSYIFIIFSLILVDYFAAIIISKAEGGKRKLFLVLSILCTCLILYIFKYFNFFGANINYIAKLIHWNYSIPVLELLLPLGLSFHTLQSLSYVIEVYRGNQKPEHHLGIYAVYVMFYPQLLAGPIERPQSLLHQFYEKHSFDVERVICGLRLMLWGFFKKMVIADRLVLFVNPIYDKPTEYYGFTLILAAVFYAIQLYADFSGYSDIAVGIARVMGFQLSANFKTPFLSKSLTEFWRTWHITLFSWLRDYIYFPLGGSRCSKIRAYFNLIVVFMISGLWHGANWHPIAFGFINAVYLIIDKYTKDFRENFIRAIFLDRIPVLNSFLQALTTFLLISFTHVVTRATYFSDVRHIYSNMLNFKSFNLPLGLDSNFFFVSAASIFILLAFDVITQNRLKFQLHYYKPVVADFVVFSLLLWIIILFGEFGGQRFIYYDF